MTTLATMDVPSFETQPPSADRNSDIPTPRRCSPRIVSSHDTHVLCRKESSPRTPPRSGKKKRPKLSAVVSSVNSVTAPSRAATPENTRFSIANTCTAEQPKVANMISDINMTVQKVFDVPIGTDTISILDQPCVSARLFACFILFSTDVPYELSLDEKLIHVAPLLPFLRAMVQVEVVALRSVETTQLSSVDQSNKHEQRNKLVHFSSFDGSCTRPPVDRQLGSAIHQHKSIIAMLNAKEHVMALTQPAIPCIHAMSTFLASKLVLCENGTSTLLACSAAIAPEFPQKRVTTLAKLYLNDFNVLERRLLALHGASHDEDASVLPDCVTHNSELGAGRTLSVEKSLAENIGRAIRFQLRLLLNASPPRMCKLDTHYETRSTAYSQVGTLVTLTMPDEAAADSAAATDACFSALVSTALCRLDEFFGMERMVSTEISVPLEIPVSFCSSGASQLPRTMREIRRNPWTADDVDIIVRDIREATTFLAAARAAQFLIDLFSAPGVSDEIKRMTGWTRLEEYASLSRRHSMWALCMADAHLVALCDVSSLLERLKVYHNAMTGSIHSCQASLDLVRQNFFIADDFNKRTISAAKKKDFRDAQKVPQLVEISGAWIEGMQQARSLPLVKDASA